MFESLVGLVGDAWWTYLLVAGIAGLDVLFPVVPSESVLLTAAIVAADGNLLLPLVVAVAAVGAFVGDNTAYAVGRRFGGRARTLLARGERSARTLGWAQRQLERRGSTLVVAGRYLPGVRTATAVGAGIVGYPWRRFVLLDAAGALTWAVLVSSVGYAGGAAFESSLLSFAFSFGVALLLAASLEAARWLLARRSTR